jgi:hypothetical protein
MGTSEQVAIYSSARPIRLCVLEDNTTSLKILNRKSGNWSNEHLAAMVPNLISMMKKSDWKSISHSTGLVTDAVINVFHALLKSSFPYVQSLQDSQYSAVDGSAGFVAVKSFPAVQILHSPLHWHTVYIADANTIFCADSLPPPKPRPETLKCVRELLNTHNPPAIQAIKWEQQPDGHSCGLRACAAAYLFCANTPIAAMSSLRFNRPQLASWLKKCLKRSTLSPPPSL